VTLTQHAHSYRFPTSNFNFGQLFLIFFINAAPTIMVGMLVCLCFASQKLSQWEFFVPARTDLGVKLLTALPL
jgi:hypothetical protein